VADANKTEKGTAHKREKAREEGQIARARDLPGAVGMLAAVAVLAWFGGSGLASWQGLLRELLAAATARNASIGLEQMRATFLLALTWSGAVAAAAWVCGTMVAFQGGFNFAGQALLRFNRFNPATNVKNLFTSAALSRIGRSILPLAVIGWFAYGLLGSSWAAIVRSGGMTVVSGLSLLLSLAVGLAWRGAAVLLGWAAIDFVLQRHNYEVSLRMTKQEVKEDTKEVVGNPETRGRIRRIQRQLARRRMMQDVPKATVVVTNPTTYAVALRYDPLTMAAPVVVAKGRHKVAERIRAIAVKSGVPIVENVPVARALYANVDLGMPIPGTLYAAVAEILAYLQRRARRA
jgi:flagellar biosynthetic protein FlhB